MFRSDGRSPDQIRPVTFTPDFAPHATGSVLVATGQTRVLCSAMIEDVVPRWMKEQRVSGGWLTAEYAMLPASTFPRKARDSSKGKVDGRSTEIQRLIGRSLRAVVDLEALGPRTLWIDCDVVQADGGTRTASINGACVAAFLACQRLVETKVLAKLPIKKLVAAVSVGLVRGAALLDLDYSEDKEASVDLNLVMTEDDQFVEIQGAGEESTFSHEEFLALVELGKRGIANLVQAQRRALALDFV